MLLVLNYFLIVWFYIFVSSDPSLYIMKKVKLLFKAYKKTDKFFLKFFFSLYKNDK